MHRHGARWLAWVTGMLLVASACGDTSGADTTAASARDGDITSTTTPTAGETPTSSTSPEAANCDQLADLFLSITQQFLDDLGDAPVSEFEAMMLPVFEEQETLPAPVAKLKASSDALRVRMDEFECTDEELQRLAFSRADRLEAHGPAGELWISILLEEDDPAEEQTKIPTGP